MHKRILLAEQSDASRGVAESLLRQNGYEVISVSSAEKTFEVVQFTKPDLIIAGSDLTANGETPLYDKIRTEPRTAQTPLLLLCDPGDSSLPFSDEVLIRRPLDPRDFLQKVTTSLTQKTSAKEGVLENPLQGANLEEEFLDAALGLDQIEVTASEVMDKTAMGSRVNKKKSSSEKMIGLDHSADSDTDQTTEGRVESLIIQGDHTDIVHESQPIKREESSATGKIEIVSDQFGIEQASKQQPEDSGGPQDYDWFVNEMRKEDVQPPSTSSPTSADSGKLSFTDPSGLVDPVTPGPPTRSESVSAGGGGKEAVEEFIEEFKREVDKINDEIPESIVVHEDNSDKKESDERLVWEEKIENLTSEQLGLFTKELAVQLADRLADIIAAKIDSEKLLALLKAELITHVRNNS